MIPSYIGKVRDVYDLGNSFILCSSDRVSAFDVVFQETIPGKGIILNTISNYWFEYFKDISNHILETDHTKFPEPFNTDSFAHRSVYVKKAKRIDYECVVRGYISGSAFKEYKNNGTIAEVPFPQGMQESQKLFEPIFTPAVKNDTGHDENISEKEMLNRVGAELFHKLKNTSIEIYTKASKKLETKGLVLCDTKLEFGIYQDQVILIDELLTPDSSRYWSIDTYQVGSSPPSFDKQILRNYLETLNWDKAPPPPSLPSEIIEKMVEKYKDLENKVRICLLEK
jgi:phosphoribosylaminoimidazole-succinocarboxamide synthase